MNTADPGTSQPTPSTDNESASETVAALAISQHKETTVFAGTRAGLYRTNALDKGALAHWKKLPAAPLEILSLGLSPTYTADTTLFVGTGQGLYLSRNDGAQWQVAPTPILSSAILCLAFSPNYKTDGIILAGTLEDGIYYSDSRGEGWSYRGFGLLDAVVYALAISPDFAHDETIFAGAETALYTSYNGARAWKLLDFPEDAAPILSLALSPQFAQDQTLYVGTERQGLYRSADRGKSWQKVDLPATCINALVTSPVNENLFAATNTGLYGSDDGGQHWHCLLDLPDVFSLAVSDDLIIAGTVNQGVWLKPLALGSAQEGSLVDRRSWQPCFTLLG